MPAGRYRTATFKSAGAGGAGTAARAWVSGEGTRKAWLGGGNRAWVSGEGIPRAWVTGGVPRRWMNRVSEGCGGVSSSQTPSWQAWGPWRMQGRKGFQDPRLPWELQGMQGRGELWDSRLPQGTLRVIGEWGSPRPPALRESASPCILLWDVGIWESPVPPPTSPNRVLLVTVFGVRVPSSLGASLARFVPCLGSSGGTTCLPCSGKGSVLLC